MDVLLIGNSDGIGLAATRQLLDRGDRVVGVSRSRSPLDIPESEDHAYEHHVCDVSDAAYPQLLRDLCTSGPGFDACVFCVGVGHGFDADDLAGDESVFDVNLAAFVRTVTQLVPHFRTRGRGHLIALSSLADQLILKDAISYSASKIGLTSYLRGLRLALRAHAIVSQTFALALSTRRWPTHRSNR